MRADARLLWAIGALIVTGVGAAGQDHAPLVRSVAELLREKYVFPDTGERAAAAIERRLSRNGYDGLAMGEIGPALQGDLRAITGDKHFAVAYHPQLYADVSASPPGGDGAPATGPDPRGPALNFGFTRIERLEGNIGLLRYDEFFSAAHSGDKARAAIELLADCDAVIIDLRANWGGDASMVTLLASYFFDTPEPVRLATAHDRMSGESTPIETDPSAPGRRIGAAPLFCVVGEHTRSAAEALSYYLRSQGRATTVGQKTSGGAHAGHIFPLTENFVMFCPTSRLEDAFTGGDWEGAGVPIDVASEEDKAIARAHLLAVEHAMTLGRTDDREQLDALADRLRQGLDD